MKSSIFYTLPLWTAISFASGVLLKNSTSKTASVSFAENPCVNNPALGKSAVWKCTERAKCSLAKPLSPKQTVVCGNGKICCPGRLPPSEFEKANAIASNKCNEYAIYMYKNYTVLGSSSTDPVKHGQELPCDTVTQVLGKRRRLTRLSVAGGLNTELEEYPHMALLGYDEDVTKPDSWRCGGSLVSEQFILTAAHCTKTSLGDGVLWAVLGILSRKKITTDLRGRNLFRIVQPALNHPQYKKEGSQYENHDVALLKLENPIKLSPIIRPICLHHQGRMPTNTSVLISGWGRTAASDIESEVLLKAGIFTIDNRVCLKQFEEDTGLQRGFDSNTMICGGHPNKSADTCPGDSGGPMQVRARGMNNCTWVQIGITSRGPQNCGEKLPAIYTRISYYLPWIQSIVWPQ